MAAEGLALRVFFANKKHNDTLQQGGVLMDEGRAELLMEALDLLWKLSEEQTEELINQIKKGELHIYGA